MTRDPTDALDNRRKGVALKRPGLIESLYLAKYPCLLPFWRYEAATHREQRIADKAMTELGAILAEHELRDIERRNGF